MLMMLSMMSMQPSGFEQLHSIGASYPSSGAWTATFEVAVGNAPGRRQVSFDVPSGSYVMATPSVILGRDLTGRRYSIVSDAIGAPITLHSQVRQISDRATPGDDEDVDQYFPSLVLIDLLARPEYVRSVEAAPEGTVRVVAAWPGGSRDVYQTSARVPPLPNFEVVLFFDLDGRMIRREHPQGLGNLTWEYEYNDRCPPGFAIPSRITLTAPRVRIVQVLTSLENIEPEHRRAAFDADSVRAAHIKDGRQTVGVRPGPAIRSMFESATQTGTTAHRHRRRSPHQRLAEHRARSNDTGGPSSVLAWWPWWSA